MICYRDTTFCGSPNCQNKCGRQFTKADAEAASRWWRGMNGEPPVAFAFFCDEPVLTQEENPLSTPPLKTDV